MPETSQALPVCMGFFFSFLLSSHSETSQNCHELPVKPSLWSVCWGGGVYFMMWFLMGINFKLLGATVEDLIWKENNGVRN